MKHIEIYTDGACSGNPGPGGWGAILRFRTAQKVYEKELSGGEANTTNNRMEMTALLEALRQLKEPCACLLYTSAPRSPACGDGAVKKATKPSSLPHRSRPQ